MKQSLESVKNKVWGLEKSHAFTSPSKFILPIYLCNPKENNTHPLCMLSAFMWYRMGYVEFTWAGIHLVGFVIYYKHL